MPDRKFCGWGNVEIKDKAGEKAYSEDLAKVMDTWLERGSPITLAHTNRIIGKGDSWRWGTNDKGHPGIHVCGHVFDDYEIDDKVWSAMQRGELPMLSIGGDIKGRRRECKGGECYVRLISPQLYEIALVPKGMNQESDIDYVDRTTKQAAPAGSSSDPTVKSIAEGAPTWWKSPWGQIFPSYTHLGSHDLGSLSLVKIDLAVEPGEKDMEKQHELDVKVKQYIAERTGSRPDAWSFVKNCPHCREWVDQYISKGRGNLEQAVKALDGELDRLYGEKERTDMATETEKKTEQPAQKEPVKKDEPMSADAVATMVKELSARVEAIEKASASAKQVAPTAAGAEKKECPPGFKYDDAAGKCLEALPDQAEQKSVALKPEELKALVAGEVAKAFKDKGLTVAETPRPELAKADQAPQVMPETGERAPTQTELAGQRMRRRHNATI